MSLFSARTGSVEHLSGGFRRVGSPSPILDATGDIGSMVVAGGILVLLGLGGVALWRSGIAEAFRSDDEATTKGAESGPSGDTAGPAKPGTETDTGTPVQDAAVNEGATPVTDEDEQEGRELSDTDIVVELLESNDGRMRQAAIVNETEWSKSKVSMVLSEMEDHGDISKLRVGRENIVSLSGNEPEAAGSPFDDE